MFSYKHDKSLGCSETMQSFSSPDPPMICRVNCVYGRWSCCAENWCWIFVIVDKFHDAIFANSACFPLLSFFFFFKSLQLLGKWCVHRSALNLYSIWLPLSPLCSSWTTWSLTSVHFPCQFMGSNIHFKSHLIQCDAHFKNYDPQKHPERLTSRFSVGFHNCNFGCSIWTYFWSHWTCINLCCILRWAILVYDFT